MNKYLKPYMHGRSLLYDPSHSRIRVWVFGLVLGPSLGSGWSSRSSGILGFLEKKEKTLKLGVVLPL